MPALDSLGLSFRDEVSEYERWLRTAGAEQGLSWQRVAVFERPFSFQLLEGVYVEFQQDWVAGSEIEDLEAYEGRFREVLASSTGWVNLDAVTIANDVLIVGLVWRPNTEERRNSPVSVNYSGLTNGELERLALAL